MSASRHRDCLKYRVDHRIGRDPRARGLETENQPMAQHPVGEHRNIFGYNVSAVVDDGERAGGPAEGNVARGLAPYSMSRARLDGRCWAGSRVTATSRLAYATSARSRWTERTISCTRRTSSSLR